MLVKYLIISKCSLTSSNHSSSPPTEPANGRPRPSPSHTPRGAYLVLQLHDELIYEVNGPDLPAVARVVKGGMEGAAKLGVVLPVKIKVGPSWGQMADYEVYLER